MTIANRLKQTLLPNEYKRNGKTCFFDPYRRRLIEITPEEVIRQKTAVFFEETVGIPHEMIVLEAPMIHYADNVNGRADIVIHEPTEDGLLKPIAIIECKNPDIPLTDHVTEQAIRYANITLSDYVFITNGVELFAYKYDETSERYLPLTEIPTYEMMESGEGSVIRQQETIFSRYNMEELQDIRLLDEYNESGPWIYGADTPNMHKPVLINLFQALMDKSIPLLEMHTENFQLTEDLGVRYLDYSNGGGGHFTGDYRSFLIEDKNGDSQIYSISVFGTSPDFRADKGEHRSSYAVLYVAVDRFKTSKPVLQLNLGAFLRDHGDCYEIVHDGRMSSQTSEEVRSFVSSRSDVLLGNDGLIHLGKLPKDRLMNMKDDADLIMNILDYAILRDEFRQSRK